MNEFEKVKEFAKSKGILICEGYKWISSYDLPVVNHPPNITFSLQDAYIALHEVAHVLHYQSHTPEGRKSLKTLRKQAFGKNPSRDAIRVTYEDEEIAYEVSKLYARELEIYYEDEFDSVREEGLSSYLKP